MILPVIKHEGIEFPDIEQAVKNVKQKKINIWPVHSNRASYIGSTCQRSCCFNRSHYDQQTLHDVGLQMIFDEGNHQEKIVKADIEEAGFELIESQRPYSDSKSQISGKIDGKIQGNDGRTYPVEIKSCSPFIYDKLVNFGPFEYFEAIKSASRTSQHLIKYPAQIQLYLFFCNEEWGMVIFKNKSTGGLKVFFVKIDFVYIDGLLKRAEGVNIAFEKWKLLPDSKKDDINEINKIYPATIDDRDYCKNCSYNHICLPDIQWGEPLKMKDDPLFEKKVDKFFEMEKEGKEFKKLAEYIKEKCRRVHNTIIGKYHITGKYTANGSWKKSIELIGRRK